MTGPNCLVSNKQVCCQANPARYLGRADELGAVQEGKRADLVLLEGDPLSDIRNTKTINAVLAGGHLFDRGTLDNLLAAAAEREAPLGDTNESGCSKITTEIASSTDSNPKRPAVYQLLLQLVM